MSKFAGDPKDSEKSGKIISMIEDPKGVFFHLKRKRDYEEAFG